MRLYIWIFTFIFLLIVSAFLYIVFAKEDKKKDEKVKEVTEQISIEVSSPGSIPKALIYDQFTNIDIRQEKILTLKNAISEHIVGMSNLINAVIIAMLANGHILIQWAPWLAKTKTVSLFGKLMKMNFGRIQFTPDMLPSDIIGVEIYNPKTQNFETKIWPIDTNLLLADEINRATPKVQSALLESMQEKQITIWNITHTLPNPFIVLATQNPIEQEWTYPLPEAQLDRFLFQINVEYPSLEEEKQILDMIDQEKPIKWLFDSKQILIMQKEIWDIKISDDIKFYIAHIIDRTRNHDKILRWASPRASIAIMHTAKVIAYLQNHDFVSHDDVHRSLIPVLGHRIILRQDFNTEYNISDLIREIV